MTLRNLVVSLALASAACATAPIPPSIVSPEPTAMMEQTKVDQVPAPTTTYSGSSKESSTTPPATTTPAVAATAPVAAHAATHKGAATPAAKPVATAYVTPVPEPVPAPVAAAVPAATSTIPDPPLQDRVGKPVSNLTAWDQGNSAPEMQITATIRKGIMHDKTLSFNAKNAKVITIGTKVTLRGPVDTAHDRSVINGLATRTAGVSEVDDQLILKK